MQVLRDHYPQNQIEHREESVATRLRDESRGTDPSSSCATRASDASELWLSCRSVGWGAARCQLATSQIGKLLIL